MEKQTISRDEALAIRPFDLENEERETLDLVRLWQDCGLTRPWNDPRKDIRRKLDEAPDLFFVALLGGRIVGSCMAGYDGHRGWFYYLGVGPAYRRLGIARELVRTAEAALLGIGCPKINLMVRSDNTAAKEFYRSIGYGDDPVSVMSRRLVPDN